jgi:uncharacterized integral membrane protein
MVIPLNWVISIIVGALISVILNSNRVTNRLLSISVRLADTYYNRQKEKLRKLYAGIDDPFELLGLSNEVYKMDYAKKPQLISVIYLIIYNAILISVTVLIYLLHYNLILYILSGFITNVIIILVIKIKQKLKIRGGNRQQHVT